MSFKDKLWQTIQSEIAYDGSPYIVVNKETVQTVRGKKISPWYRITDSNFVVVVPITENDEIIMVEQYRHGANVLSLELPAGTVSDGETGTKTAMRELKEETGYEAKSYKKLGRKLFDDAPLKTSSFEIYIAKNAKKVADQSLDESEEINVIRKPIDEAIHLALNGSIISPPSIIAILWTAFHVGRAYRMNI